jgi:hypothetical protein
MARSAAAIPLVDRPRLPETLDRRIAAGDAGGARGVEGRADEGRRREPEAVSGTEPGESAEPPGGYFPSVEDELKRLASEWRAAYFECMARHHTRMKLAESNFLC